MDDSTHRDIGIRLTSDPDVTRIEQPRTAGARPAVQLPLRLLLVSDLTPADQVTDWSASSRVVSVDSNNFDVLMQQLAPRVSMEVPNQISDSPGALDVELTFTSLRAFNPEQVARQVPPLAHLFEIRALVSRLKSGTLEMDEFRARIQETGVDTEWAEQITEALSAPRRDDAASPRRASGEDEAASTRPVSGEKDAASTRSFSSDDRSGGDAVDRLLDMVDLGNDSEQDSSAGSRQDPRAGTRQDAPARSPRRAPARSEQSAGGFMGALVQAVTGGSEPEAAVEKSAAELLIADLDDVLSTQLNSILNHPSFRRLEAAWRGLKLLVDRIDVRSNVQLDVLPAGKSALSEALYYQVTLPEHSEDNERPPLAALVLDLSFDNGNADIALLDDLAETGSSLQVPVIASADPSFFGVAEPGGLHRLPSLRRHLEGPQYIAWNKLRQKDDARHLALVVPPFLLRYPYGAENPVIAFDFREEGQLWSGGALALAALMAASFKRTGWPTHVRGNGDNRIDNLPVVATSSAHTPLAALLPDGKQADLADAGFVVLGSRANHDAVYVAHAPTIRYVGAYESADAAEEARAHSSLPCQLFVARAAQFMLAFQREIAPGADVTRVEADLASRLKGLMSTSSETAPEGTVSIERVPEAKTSEHEVLAIRLRPPGFILDESVSLVLHLRVPS